MGYLVPVGFDEGVRKYMDGWINGWMDWCNDFLNFELALGVRYSRELVQGR